MKHQMKQCALKRNGFLDREWHCCECGWPTRSCLETWPELRINETTASAPKCGDDAAPYLICLGTLT